MARNSRKKLGKTKLFHWGIVLLAVWFYGFDGPPINLRVLQVKSFMSIVFFSGFETGTITGEKWTLFSGTPAIESTIVHGGAYSCKINVTGTANPTLRSPALTGMSSTWARVYLRCHTNVNPPAQQIYECIRFAAGGVFPGEVNRVTNTNGTLALRLSYLGTPVGADYPIVADTWYCVELYCKISATVGAVEMRIDQVVVATGSNLNTGTTNIVNFDIKAQSISTANIDNYFDDVVVSNSAYPGPGRCIARQGIAGTPTYDSFTKNGAATAALCWSDTPFNTGTNCTSIVNGGAQTMLTAPFNVTQSGHGIDTINELDTINACRTIIYGKVAVATTHSIRRRLSGVDTDTSISVTTADTFLNEGIWTDSLANLNSSEIGVLHGANVNLLTIEDVWLMVDYTPVGLPWLFQSSDQPFPSVKVSDFQFPEDPYPRPTALAFTSWTTLPEALPALNLSRVLESPTLLDPYPRPAVPSLMNWAFLPEFCPLPNSLRIREAEIMLNPNPIGLGPSSLDWWVLIGSPYLLNWYGRILGQAYFDGLVQIGVPTAQLFNLKTAGVGL